MCVTSPPYWGLRDYGHPGQLGLEPTISEYVERLTEVFSLVRQLLSEDGTLWLNVGDSYNAAGRKGHGTRQGFKQGTNRASAAGHDHVRPSADDLKPKDLCMIPARVALALQADGWYLRSDIIWHKPNPMPESVTDRPTKSHEYLFLLSKNERYYYDHEAMREAAVKGAAGSLFHTGKTGEHQLGRASRKPRIDAAARKELRTDTESRHRSSIPGGQSLMAEPDGRRNRRTVWTVPTQPYAGAHFAVFPPRLIEPCILGGSRRGDIVFDPFFGSGTTGAVAARHGRLWLGCELNEEYKPLWEKRTA